MRSNNPPTPPDTLSGTVRAEDTDGLDSVWVTVDSAVAGEDGGFDQVFSAPIQIRARDIAGFEVIRDTNVLVVP